MPDYEANTKKNLEEQLEELAAQEAAVNAAADENMNAGAAGQNANAGAAGQNADIQHQLLAQYKDMLRSLRTLNALMQEQYTIDRTTGGLYRFLDEESYQNISRCYEEAARCCDRLLKNGDARKKKSLQPLFHIVEKVSEDLAGDMQALREYPRKTKEQKETVTFQSLIDQSRMPEVDLGDEEMSVVGGNASRRFIFKYTMPNGEKISGVFTRRKYLNGQDALQEVTESISGKYEYMKPMMEMMNEFFRIGLKEGEKGEKSLKKTQDLAGIFRMVSQRTEKKSQEDKVKWAITAITNIVKKANGGKLPEAAANDLASYAKDRGFYEGICYMVDKMNSLCIELGCNTGNAQISEGSRIDSRNSAMSVVADLLGRPDLLAKAMPMKVRYKGQVMEGTFMEMAKGLDCNHPDQYFEDYELSNYYNKSGVRDICDLPVIDFICGNTDRHMGNMMYQFDQTSVEPREHQFLGLQGIDNDMSFGTYVPETSGEYRSCMVAPDDFQVISESMAKAVEALKPEVLRYKLRNMELTEEQLDAACQRLKLVQAKIREGREFYRKPENAEKVQQNPRYFTKGHTRIMPDSQVQYIDFDRMKTGNRFCIYDTFSDVTAIPARGDQIRPIDAQKEIRSVGGFIMSAQEGESAVQMVDRLAAVTEEGKTSREFEELRRWTIGYRDFCRKNEGRMLSSDLYHLRDKYFRRLSECCDAYLLHKKKEVFHSKYAKTRIRTVTELKEQIEAIWEHSAPDYEGLIGAGRREEDNRRIMRNLHLFEDRQDDELKRKVKAEAMKIYQAHQEELEKEARERTREKPLRFRTDPEPAGQNVIVNDIRTVNDEIEPDGPVNVL